MGKKWKCINGCGWMLCSVRVCLTYNRCEHTVWCYYHEFLQWLYFSCMYLFVNRPTCQTELPPIGFSSTIQHICLCLFVCLGFVCCCLGFVFFLTRNCRLLFHSLIIFFKHSTAITSLNKQQRPVIDRWDHWARERQEHVEDLNTAAPPPGQHHTDANMAY